MNLIKKIYLDKDLFYKSKYSKSLIVLGDTKRYNLNHINYSKSIIKKDIPHFTIFKNGKIIQHFPIQYYSDFILEKTIARKSISILLENLGWLSYDVYRDEYYNWTNNEKTDFSNIYEKLWKNKRYWDMYTKEQYQSLQSLLYHLIETHNIEKTLINHNNILENFYTQKGIIYMHNISDSYYGLNPSFDYKKFYKQYKKGL